MTVAVSVAAAAHRPQAVLAQPTPPQRWAVLVGINQYLSPLEIPSLSYAENDVDGLDGVLRRDGYQVISLKGATASRLGIIAALQNVATRVKQQDTFLLYLAGHGLRSRINSRVYWLTSDTTLGFLEATSIRMSHMMDYVADIKAANKLILLDHCFSGEVINELAEAAGPPAGGATTTTNTTTPPGAPPPAPPARAPDPGVARGPGTGPQISRNVDPEPIATTFKSQWSTDLGGSVMLAAARGNAYEIGGDVKHGLFTQWLLKALDSRDADKNPADGKLSADELRTFVQDKVLDASRALGQGMEQRVMDLNTGSLSGFVVISSLRATGLDQAKQDRDTLKPLLADWYSKGYLSSSDEIVGFAALDKAVDLLERGVPVDADVQAVVKAVRDAAALPYGPRERADLLTANLRALRGGR
jgi:hypothetical protein